MRLFLENSVKFGYTSLRMVFLARFVLAGRNWAASRIHHVSLFLSRSLALSYLFNKPRLKRLGISMSTLKNATVRKRQRWKEKCHPIVNKAAVADSSRVVNKNPLESFI